MLYNIILFRAVMALGFLHPFHVSVTEMDYNKRNRHLEISIRIFTDDLENILERYANTDFDLYVSLDDTVTQKVLKSYLEANFSLKQNGKPIPLDYVGSEADADVIWCYLESPPLKSPETVNVRNTLLLDLFDDQINLVHLVIGHKTRSRKYYQENYSGPVITDRSAGE